MTNLNARSADIMGRLETSTAVAPVTDAMQIVPSADPWSAIDSKKSF
jgi:hypothetical protein